MLSNKKVGWECSNSNEYLDGTVCKPICGPGAMPTGTNNVCACDKKGRCKWKGFIKDHCQRMMCPPLPEPVNADFIKTPKKMSKTLQRSGGVLPTSARWAFQFRSQRSCALYAVLQDSSSRVRARRRPPRPPASVPTPATASG